MKRNITKFIAVLTACCALLFVLVACSGDEAQDDQDNSQPPLSQLNTSLPPDAVEPNVPGDVGFTLQPPSDTNFGSISNDPADMSDGLYTFEDGYAYALDPNTFEKTGPALDPITYQPVDVQPEVPVVDPDPTSVPSTVESEPPEEVPQDVKLPNTGIFLEDD